MDPSLADQLNAEREQTIERIAALAHERQTVIDSTVQTGVDDEHDPEGATIAWERAQVEALLEQSRNHLSELDRALRRLDEGGYGVCEVCGDPIAPERLAARPTARTCIGCASRR
jgi:DnaK suppressor protein